MGYDHAGPNRPGRSEEPSDLGQLDDIREDPIEGIFRFRSQ